MTEDQQGRFVRNECGQRAAARVLSRRLGGGWRDHYARLRNTHPPDTPFRLLGTTPKRVADMLSASGVKARVVAGRGMDQLRAGALACIDTRPLVGGLPRLHWVEVEAVAPAGVQALGRVHDRERWMRAWSCRCSPFPMHRRALVVCEP